MWSAKRKKKILTALDDHQRISGGPMALEALLSSAFPGRKSPPDVQFTLTKLHSQGYIEVVESGFSLVSASITPQGREFLRILRRSL